MALLLGTPFMRTRALLLLALGVAGTGAGPAQAAPPSPGAEASLRLVRSTSGSRGSLQGSRYVVEDPRTTFAADVDRQVIVHFDWEGRPGSYRCEGRWKDPSGKVVLVAPLEYQATSRRFGLYWTLALPTTAARRGAGLARLPEDHGVT